MTGTGIVPPDSFTLHHGDEIRITIEPAGTLVNAVRLNLRVARMNLLGTSLIAGTRGHTGGRSFKAMNPATGTALEPAFHEASDAEVAHAMEAAAAAFVDYRARPAAKRAEFLEHIAAGIEALGDALIERATAETGLPAARIAGERGRTCGQLRLFAQVVREGSWVDARIDHGAAGPPAAAAT